MLGVQAKAETRRVFKNFHEAKLKSEELELVELEGTERQIELGTVIRIENINTFLEHQQEFRKFEAMVMRIYLKLQRREVDTTKAKE